MELKPALDLFLGEYAKATTRQAYEGVLAPMVTAIGPGRETSLITNADIHAYAQKVKQRTARPATFQKHVKGIKRFFNWLVEIKELTVSPARTLRQQRIAPAVSKEKAATDEETDLVSKACFGHARNYALARFLIDTGCRAGGISGLKLDSLDLENLRATVTEKGDKDRPVWFSSETAQALRVWLIQRPPVDSPYVFCKKDGAPLSSAAVSQIIRRAGLGAGCRSLGAHAFRHRVGHKLADAHVAVTVAATILGHADAKITMDYYYPRDYERAEKELRRLHGESKPTSKIVSLHLVKNR